LFRRDEKYDWKDKRVAVIGNGASGIQCVAAMHAQVSRLVNYVRSPTWITPNINAEMTKTGDNFAYTLEEQEQFKNDPKEFFEFRKEVENQ
jgi:cation diffusion facilitator CzcD-associated flavoprotein CzcO